MSLTQNRQPSIKTLREFVSADFVTGQLIWRHRDRQFFKTDRSHKIWNGRYAGKIAGSLGNRGYKTVRLLNWPQLQHRVLWALYYGVWPTDEIDHIDRDRLNNSISNLRLVRKADQQKNMSVRSDNKTGVSGVDWMKSKGKWRVRVGTKHIGLFDSFEDAKSARQSAAEMEGYSGHIV